MRSDAVFIVAAAVALAGCSTADPGIEVRTVPYPVEIPRDCPGTVPERPTPLVRPLPTDLLQLAAVLGAKLAEYSDEGKYADQAESYFRTCPPSSPGASQ